MSSVNGSDSSGRQDEVVRRNREDYKQRESDLVKKHQKELRRINEAHYSELENLKEVHDTQMTDLQGKSKENLSRRDMRFKKEVDNLRALHRKQLSDLHAETEKKLSRTDDATKRNIEVMKSQFDERTADMNQSHINAIKNKDENYLRSIEGLREDQKEAISRNRENLKAKHKEELSTLKKAETEGKSDLAREYRNYRESASSQLKNQELRHMQDRQRASDNFIGTLRRERVTQEDSKAGLREGFSEAIKDIQEKYHDKYQENQRTAGANQEGLRKDVHERVNGQVRSLEEKVKDLQAENVNDRVGRDRRMQREIANARESFQANVEDYKGQKEQLLEELNKGNSKEINELQRDHSQQMKTSSRFYLNKMQTQDAKAKESIFNMKNDYEARNSQLSQQADNRVKNVVETVTQEKQRMAQTYKDNFDMLREQQADELKSLQLNHIEERAKAMERLKQQMRERELEHQSKVNSMKGSYEKRIAELNDQRMLDKRSSSENVKRLTEGLKRAHHLELETQQVQFTDKIAKIQEQHNQELQTLNQRHQEQVDHLVGVVRKS